MRVSDEDDELGLPPKMSASGATGEGVVTCEVVRGGRCEGRMIGCRGSGDGDGEGVRVGDPALGVRLPGVEG